MPTYHVDLENGNDANDGSTWALAKKNPVLTGSSSSDYNTCKIAKTSVASLGQNALWTNKSKIITLATQVTQQIDDALGSSWTTSTGVSGYSDTNRKLGANRQRLDVTNSMATGKCAYKTLASTLDLSGYEKISFWIMVNIISYANARGFRLCLCSDSSGDTVVNSFPIDTMNIANSTLAMTLDYGSALGSSINSIALYCDNTYTSTVRIYLNHIFAANDLHLKTAIGKGASQSTEFFAVQSIVGTTLCIDSGESIATTSSSRGYYGTTETVETFVRPLIVMEQNLIPNTYFIVFDAGWDTATDTQNGETWVDCRNIIAPAIYTYQGGYVGLKNMCFVGLPNCTRFISVENLQITAGRFLVDDLLGSVDGAIVNNFNSLPNQFGCASGIIKNVKINSHITTPQALQITNDNSYYENLEICNNSAKPLAIGFSSGNIAYSGSNNYFKNITFLDNVSYLVVAHFGNTIDNINNTTMEVFDEVYLKNCPAVIVGTTSHNVYEFNAGNVAGAYKYSKSRTVYIEWQTTVKHMSETGAWHVYSSINHPLSFKDRNPEPFKIAEIAVEEGVQITIRAWISANYGGFITEQARLAIRAITSPAVDTDYSSLIDKDNTWHEVGLTFIPDRTGLVLLEFSCAGEFYVGSISIT